MVCLVTRWARAILPATDLFSPRDSPPGWVFLAAMIGMYGVANLLQSIAAAQRPAARHARPEAADAAGPAPHLRRRPALPDPRLRAGLPRPARPAAVPGAVGGGRRPRRHRRARRVCPQVAAAPRRDRAAGAARASASPALVVSAEPHPSRPLGIAGVGRPGRRRWSRSPSAGFFAARLRGVPGLGRRSARWPASPSARPPSPPAAGQHARPPSEFITDPLLYLLIAHSLVGQLLLGLAMQRGSTTAAVAAMDAAAAVPAAIIGLLFLGDRITPGPRVAGRRIGFLLTLGSVIGLTFFAEPQHHHQLVGPAPATGPPRTACAPEPARAAHGGAHEPGRGPQRPRRVPPRSAATPWLRPRPASPVDHAATS